jgi:hypothetical protein
VGKLPYFQFYPGDWMKDPALSICSAGARGVWMDVLCLMFESPKRGFLITNSRPWTLEQIAVAVRGDWQENLVYLKELVHNSVMAQATKGHKFRGVMGAFYSRRIVADEGRREAWRLQKQGQRVENKRRFVQPMSAPSSSSSSSSSSTSNTTTNPPTPLAGGSEKPTVTATASTKQYVAWDREVIEIETGNRKRVLSEREWSMLQGSRAENVLSKIQSHGFTARFVSKEEIESWKAEAAMAKGAAV